MARPEVRSHQGITLMRLHGLGDARDAYATAVNFKFRGGPRSEFGATCGDRFRLCGPALGATCGDRFRLCDPYDSYEQLKKGLPDDAYGLRDATPDYATRVTDASTAKPFYKKGWFWAAAGGAAALGVGTALAFRRR